MRRLLLLPYTFVLMNWAAIAALWWVVRGRGLDAVWVDREPTAADAVTAGRADVAA